MLPTITLLSPVSPIAWLPVAIFLFGIGNGPAIFMVVVALFFHMVLATITQIDGVSRNLINVARTMGASKRQIYARVIVPAILPGMLAVLRMNLFGAWMVVLIAESTGVGYGMGQVIMLARNTFNPSLVFFTIAVIGVLGFTFDWLLRQAQRRILYWLPDQRRSCVASERSATFSSKDAVVCRGVGKTWAAGTKRAHEALRDIDLDVAAGRVRGLPRPLGLRQEHLALSDRRPGGRDRRPDLVVRRPVETPSPERSLIFQETSLFPWLTVWENVSFGLSIRGASKDERRRRRRARRCSGSA